MIRTYRKTVTIKAEQFDGSEVMIDKYGMYMSSVDEIVSDCHLVLPTLEGDMTIHHGDWIATGVNGEHWAISNDIFKKTYEEVN